MGKRCGCAGDCACRFENGRGARLSGAGTKADPVVVEIRDGQAFVRGATTDTVSVTVTGLGTSDSPYHVLMDAWPGQSRPVVYRFATAGVYTWAKSSFGTLMRGYLVGAGGGGAGAGAAGPSSDAFHPTVEYGLGGAPGRDLVVDAVLADLPASMAVTVGAGGTGGPRSAAGTIVETSGHAGVNGGASSLDRWTAGGGSAGLAADQGVSDTRPTAGFGAGGAGGLYMGGGPETPRQGKPGGAGYPGQVPVGGLGGVESGLVLNAGGPSPLQFRPRGTGGGGGYGSLASYGDGNVSGAYGGDGAPGAGGGGGGVGAVYGGAGGRGGDGVVVILIQ